MVMFSSRPPFSDDPFPHVVGNVRLAYEGTLNGTHSVYAPDPEFDRPQYNPTNPILTWAREAGLDVALDEVTFSSGSYLIGAWVGDQQVTVRHVIHARHVLERLARLS